MGILRCRRDNWRGALFCVFAHRGQRDGLPVVALLLHGDGRETRQEAENLADRKRPRKGPRRQRETVFSASCPVPTQGLRKASRQPSAFVALPGRGVEFQSDSAWEQVVLLSPCSRSRVEAAVREKTELSWLGFLNGDLVIPTPSWTLWVARLC